MNDYMNFWVGSMDTSNLLTYVWEKPDISLINKSLQKHKFIPNVFLTTNPCAEAFLEWNDVCSRGTGLEPVFETEYRRRGLTHQEMLAILDGNSRTLAAMWTAERRSAFLTYGGTDPINTIDEYH